MKSEGAETYGRLCNQEEQLQLPEGAGIWGLPHHCHTRDPGWNRPEYPCKPYSPVATAALGRATEESLSVNVLEYKKKEISLLPHI